MPSLTVPSPPGSFVAAWSIMVGMFAVWPLKFPFRVDFGQLYFCDKTSDFRAVNTLAWLPGFFKIINTDSNSPIVSGDLSNLSVLCFWTKLSVTTSLRHEILDVFAVYRTQSSSCKAWWVYKLISWYLWTKRVLIRCFESKKKQTHASYQVFVMKHTCVCSRDLKSESCVNA